MNNENTNNGDDERAMRETFDSILLYDVIRALERVELDHTQSVKRDLIRTMFAAIEGSVWGYREHVRSIAYSIDEITPMMDMAFSETTYFVSENGKLEQQTRFISMTAMIRFVTRVAQDMSPGLHIDFGSKGWSDLQKAMAIRNRITHPKSKADLEITAEDIAISTASLFWLLELIHEVMQATNSSAENYLANTRLFFAKLINGDEMALAAYQNALNSLDC